MDFLSLFQFLDAEILRIFTQRREKEHHKDRGFL